MLNTYLIYNGYLFPYWLSTSLISNFLNVTFPSLKINYIYYPNPYKQLCKVIIIPSLQMIKPDAHKS